MTNRLRHCSTQRSPQAQIRLVNDFDWTGWKGEIEATLLFVIRRGEILLIEKKRGHGAGKINGPGGKIDPGESPLECAVRETTEELGIIVSDAGKVGELSFQMSDYPSIFCHVFVAGTFEGTPVETDEAVPLWTPLGEIPYGLMWQDDRYWLPFVLDGRNFAARFVFKGEKMVWKEIVEKST